jgi:hypothetical protein
MIARLPRNKHYFYDSYLNRVNIPTLQNYIRLVHNNLRGNGLLRGLDNISAKTGFCTNSGATGFPRTASARKKIRAATAPNPTHCHSD